MDRSKGILTRYFIDALSAMAYGLFSSLIIGVIISQISKISFFSFFSIYNDILSASSLVVGCAIGVSIGVSLEGNNLAIFSLCGVGAISYKLGGPVGCYVSSVVACEIGTLFSGKTKFDIVLVPFVTLLIGVVVAKIVGVPISKFMTILGNIINNATNLQPIFMGIVISVCMGIFLTAPISSAAIAISLNLSGIAAGAATVGCCVHMLGFAIASYNENKMGGFLAQGIGTSMLQVPNIIKHPIIILPPIIVSAILGPIATTILPITNSSWGAGMGTSGLVGIIGAFNSMVSSGEYIWFVVFKIFILLIFLPMLLTFLISFAFRKAKWIRKGYMKL